ncbi:hypothetical protein RJT34_12647 [Clitoria ternatea]|uniref:Uncharacterized protein n=1 Tax=Clitoria ternatea TaxID=43366 RepID=A0AAN9PLK6_CLITE
MGIQPQALGMVFQASWFKVREYVRRLGFNVKSLPSELVVSNEFRGLERLMDRSPSLKKLRLNRYGAPHPSSRSKGKFMGMAPHEFLQEGSVVRMGMA